MKTSCYPLTLNKRNQLMKFIGNIVTSNDRGNRVLAQLKNLRAKDMYGLSSRILFKPQIFLTYLKKEIAYSIENDLAIYQPVS